METFKSLALIAAAVIIVGTMQERDEADRRATEAAFRLNKCWPAQPYEASVARMDERRAIHCTTYANTGYGRAATLASSATLEGRR